MEIERMKRSNVAVASINGSEVDLHIGHARKFLIYGPGDDGTVRMLDVRTAPEPGGGEARWKALAEVLADCFALLASGGGPRPLDILENEGIDVFIAKGDIKRVLEIVFDEHNQH